MQKLNHSIYNIGFNAALPAVLLRLYLKGFKQPEYRQRIAERMGYPGFTLDEQKPTVWFHAASVGEVVALTPLIKQFHQAHPDYNVVLTTMTPTGSEQAQKRLGDTVYHSYVPYDYPRAVNRYLDAIRPELLVIMETELWPNMISLASKRHIPVMIANARLSPPSVPKYQKLNGFMKPIFEHISIVAPQSDDDYERFRQIGFNTEQLKPMGNIKFDLQVGQTLTEAADQLRSNYHNQRPTWVAGSTHEGEEAIILEAHRQLQKQYPEALLILVPRHPQRFDQVASLCYEQGFNTSRRSQIEGPQSETDVFLVDQMGELVLMYACADIAFVGGSLVPNGGHNPLEPTAVNVPVISGRHVFNFTEIFSQLQQAEGMQYVDSSETLAETLASLFNEPQKANKLTESASEVLQANQGAIDNHLQAIDTLLSKR